MSMSIEVLKVLEPRHSVFAYIVVYGGIGRILICMYV